MTSVLVEQLRALTLDNHASLLDRVTLVDIQGSDPYALSDFISSRPPWYQLAVALVCADLLDPMFFARKAANLLAYSGPYADGVRIAAANILNSCECLPPELMEQVRRVAIVGNADSVFIDRVVSSLPEQ
ncbi:MAG: hypothetical protein KIT54_07245 [Phycisphaeraceae bacterium]|nr:hypothetical protein [Phycisphaeraceae bacterium]